MTMRRTLRLIACGWLAAVAGHLYAYPLVAQAPREGPAKAGHYDLKPALDRYCITCHNAKLKTAGLSLEQVDPFRVGGDVEMWEKVARKLRTREMPPSGSKSGASGFRPAAAKWMPLIVKSCSSGPLP